MTRKSYDEAEAMRHRPKDEPFTDGLFAPLAPSLPAWALSWKSLTDDQRRAQRERWEEQLTPLALELAARRGPEGITASELIAEGMTRGVLLPERPFVTNNPRVYAFVGHFLARLAREEKLARQVVPLPGGGSLHVTRTSERTASHGNAGGVYVLGRAA